MGTLLKLMLYALHFCYAWAMCSKRPLPDLAEVPLARRLRYNLADLFLGNEVSGARSASLFEDAAHANAEHVRDLARVSKDKHNATRNLRRNLARRSQWVVLRTSSSF